MNELTDDQVNAVLDLFERANIAFGAGTFPSRESILRNQREILERENAERVAAGNPPVLVDDATLTEQSIGQVRLSLNESWTFMDETVASFISQTGYLRQFSGADAEKNIYGLTASDFYDETTLRVSQERTDSAIPSELVGTDAQDAFEIIAAATIFKEISNRVISDFNNGKWPLSNTELLDTNQDGVSDFVIPPEISNSDVNNNLIPDTVENLNNGDLGNNSGNTSPPLIINSGSNTQAPDVSIDVNGLEVGNQIPTENNSQNTANDGVYVIREGDTASNAAFALGFNYYDPDQKARFLQENNLTEDENGFVLVKPGQELFAPYESDGSEGDDFGSFDGADVPSEPDGDFDFLDSSSLDSLQPVTVADQSIDAADFGEDLYNRQEHINAQNIQTANDRYASGVDLLQSHDQLDRAIGLLTIAGGTDYLVAGINGGSPNSGLQGAISVIDGIVDFDRAESGFERLQAGVQVVDGVLGAAGETTLSAASVGGGLSFGQVLSLVGLAVAIDEGDWGAAVSNAYQLYESTQTATAATTALPTTFQVPYVAYIAAIAQALDGDLEGAAETAILATIAAQLGIWGVVVYVVYAVVNYEAPPRSSLDFLREDDGSLGTDYWFNGSVDGTLAVEGKTLDYLRDENGDFVYAENDEGVLERVTYVRDETDEERAARDPYHAESIVDQGGVLLDVVRRVESGLSDIIPGGRLNTDLLSSVHFEWKGGKNIHFQSGYLGGNNVRWDVGLGIADVHDGMTGEEFTAAQEQANFLELIRAVADMTIVSHHNDSWIVGERTFTDSDGNAFTASVYDPFGSTRPPNVSDAIPLGIWSGGGNVGGSQALVETTAEDFSTDSNYVYRDAEQEFEEVKKTWRNTHNIFAGEGGLLLALGIASGQTSIAQILEAGFLADPETDPLKVEYTPEQEARILAFLAENSDFIAADGVTANEYGRGFRPSVTIEAKLDEVFAEQVNLILGRGQDTIYPEEGFFLNASVSNADDANQRFLEEAQLRSEIVRELAASNEQFEFPRLQDIDIQIDGNTVTITGLDVNTREQVVLASFERETVTFGESDVFAAIEDRPFYTTIDELLSNDREGVVFAGVGGARNGSVSVDANGNVRFIPDENFFGLASFTYSVRFDGETQAVTAYVFVANTSDAPIAVDDEITRAENTPVSLNALLLNDTDPDGDGLRVSGVSSVSHGQIVADSQGNYTYIPEPGYVGEVNITYTVSDNAGTGVRTSAAVSTLTFTENVNDAPFVHTEVFNDAVEDNAYVISANSLLANDSDPEGGVLSIVSVEAIDPSQGSVLFDEMAGTITFVPTADFHGTADIRYVVTDDGLLTADGKELDPQTSTSTASLVFAPTPDPYTTVDHSLAVNESGTVILTNEAILAGVNNVDNVDGSMDTDVVAVRLANGETGGQVRILPNGDVQFTPLSSHNGNVTFEVRLSRDNPEVDGGKERIVSTVSVTVLAGNDAPEANLDQFTDAVEETAYTFNQSDLLVNDTDAEGDAFTFADIRLVDESQGSVAYNAATGDITVTPNADVFGTIALTYRIQETVSGQFSTGDVELVFANTNDTASVSNKMLTATEDTPTIFSSVLLLDASLGEAVDVDGETLTITGATLLDDTQGSISVNGSGDVVFTPAENFHGNVLFTFEASDGVEAVTANAIIEVASQNDLPMAADDERLDGVEDQTYTLQAADLLANDGDEDHELVLQNIRVLDPANGTVTHNTSTGEIVFTPNQDVNGAVLFEYTAAEGVGTSPSPTAAPSVPEQATAQLRLVLAPQDDTATISNKTFTVDENDAVTIFTQNALLDASLGEDTDADGETLRVVSAQLNNASDGTITVLANGDVQFTPNPSLVGVDSHSGFEFTISDGVSDITASADVVRGAPAPIPATGNQGPVLNTANPALPLALANGQEETDYHFNIATLEAAAIDPEGDAFFLTDIVLSDPSHGVLVWDRDTNEVIITPNDNVFGDVTINYRLTDDKGASSDLSAVVHFNNVDDTPEVQEQGFRNGLFNVNEDAVNHLFTKETLLDGRLEDVDNEALTILAVRSLTPAGIQHVTLGSDESVLLTTVPDYASDIDAALDDDVATLANDVVFQIDVTDGNTTQTVDMTVRVFPENDAPDVTDDTRSMAEGSVAMFAGADLLANDRDAEGDAFAILGIWAVSNGTADYDKNTDQITYKPDENTIGSQWVDYLVKDDNGAFSVARLNVDVINADDPVVANDDVFIVAEDSDFIFDASEFTGNDTNLDQEVLRITSIDDSSFTHGSLVLLPDGRVSYVAEPDYVGKQSFQYTVEDDSGNVSQATVEFTVQNINDVPRVTVLNQTIDEDTPQAYSFDQLLSQATDADGDWMTVAGVRSIYGDVTYNEDLQQIEYIPTEHFNSTLFGQNAIVEYLLVDENGGEAWGEINITVNPINDEPVAYDDVIAAWSRGPIAYSNVFSQIDLLQNDQEFDGEVLRVLSTTQGTQGGALTLNPSSGVLSYTSADGFTGVDTFSYVVGDGVPGSEDTADVQVTVFENSAPVAEGFLVEADEDTVLTFDYAGDFAPHVADVDLNNALGLPEGHRIVAVGNAQNGEVVLNADGTVTFTPDANYNTAQFVDTRGTARFDYVVQDIVGNTSQATTEILFNPVDDAPEAVTDVIAASIDEDNRSGLQFDPQNFVLNDFDVDDANLPAGQIGPAIPLSADNGRIFDNGDGTFRYVPNENFNGTDNIRYQIADGTGLIDIGAARVTVNPVNDNPVASATAGQGNDKDLNTLRGVLNSAFDVDGDTLRINRIIGVSGNVSSASVSGSNITWRGSEGRGRINYEITDGNGGFVQTYADVNILHVNSVPYVSRLTISSITYLGIGGDEEPYAIVTGQAFGIDDDNDGSLRVRLDRVTGGASLFDDGFGNFRVQTAENRDSITLRFIAIDGESAFTFKDFTVDTSNRSGGGVSQEPPIILDLNDNGLELKPYNVFNATQFDIDGDGELERLSFAANGDGVLAIDLDQDGKIDRAEEIVFTGYVDGAETDLEGLRHFDTNQDGLLNAADEQFAQFGAVVDNGDGVITAHEFVSLSDLDIESINLTSDEVERSLGDSGKLSGIAEATKTDGSTIQVGDASLSYSNGTPEILLPDDTLNRPSDIVEPQTSDSVATNEVQTDMSLLLLSPDVEVDTPTDDDVNHAVLLDNQRENAKPHAEDLSSQATLPTDDLISEDTEEPMLVAV